MSHRCVAQKPQLWRAEGEITLRRHCLGHLQAQTPFADVQRLRIDKFILASQILPEDGDDVVASLSVLTPQIVPGTHESLLSPLT